MHDINYIRENPEAFDAAMQRRGLEALSSKILEMDKARREQITERQAMEQERNATAKSIGQLKGQGKHEEAEAQLAKANELKEKLAAFDAQLETNPLDDLLLGIPNIMDADVPDGVDEEENEELRTWGEPTKFDFAPTDHVDLGMGLDGMDFETAAKISGSRFVILSGQVARLERALAQFMLDMHTKQHGYTEVQPPLLVRDDAMYGTGQLPKFGADSFKTTTDHWLIATSEIALTNIVADCIIDEDYLPRRYTAYTPCFRSEAGSAGRDTRGLIRQHQFYKVELVSITKPEDSEVEHERMTKCAEGVLQQLKLPYRVMLLCSGDTGFGARKTYDLEVWLPGQDCYREISSCSNTGAFQARRMKARFKREGAKKPEFVHTLNGSALAVGRTLVAVLENYQNSDGSVSVPQVLVPYMDGVTKLEVA